MDLARFDQSSRGVWGSIKLLTRLRCVHLASLGAALTVLSTANDPFMQQVIRYSPCPQVLLQNRLATIARTNNYTGSGIRTWAHQSSLDLPMRAAIYKGVYDAFSPVQASCATGNCTFKEFRTVGMCSECADISPTINKTVEVFPKFCNIIYQTLPDVNVTMPSGGIAMSMGPVNPKYSSSMPVVTDVLYFSNQSQLSGQSEPPADSLTNCTNFSVKATQCSLFPCLRTYSVNVTNGLLSEILLFTARMEENPNSGFSSYATLTLPCLVSGKYLNETFLATLYRSTSGARPPMYEPTLAKKGYRTENIVPNIFQRLERFERLSEALFHLQDRILQASFQLPGAR